MFSGIERTFFDFVRRNNGIAVRVHGNPAVACGDIPILAGSLNFRTAVQNPRPAPLYNIIRFKLQVAPDPIRAQPRRMQLSNIFNQRIHGRPVSPLVQ